MGIYGSTEVPLDGRGLHLWLDLFFSWLNYLMIDQLEFYHVFYNLISDKVIWEANIANQVN